MRRWRICRERMAAVQSAIARIVYRQISTTMAARMMRARMGQKPRTITSPKPAMASSTRRFKYLFQCITAHLPSIDPGVGASFLLPWTCRFGLIPVQRAL